MDTYINTLDGFITIFLSGVVHKGTLLLQEHLDAVDGPSSEREKGASVEMISEHESAEKDPHTTIGLS